MKKIRDERLILRNLKNIRIVFVIQTLGIVGILGYDLVTKGMDAMTSNPLWPLLMISMVIYAYLSMSISVEHEKLTEKRAVDFYLYPNCDFFSSSNPCHIVGRLRCIRWRFNWWNYFCLWYYSDYLRLSFKRKTK